MKYFTFDWWHAGQDSKTSPTLINTPADEYESYLSTIIDKIPERLRVFRKQYTIHDGCIIELNLTQNELIIIMDINEIVNNDWGEDRTVRLTYTGVEHFHTYVEHFRNYRELHSLSFPGQPGYGDLGYDELEFINENCFQHRFLFSSGIEFSFDFSGFDFKDLGPPNVGEHTIEKDRLLDKPRIFIRIIRYFGQYMRVVCKIAAFKCRAK